MSEFFHPKLACDVILFNRHNQVLVGERLREPRKGKLNLPGGFVDKGDGSLEVAALRELEEETGLRPDEVGTLSYNNSFEAIYEWEEVKHPLIVVTFWARLLVNPTGIRSGDEMGELGWISPHLLSAGLLSQGEQELQAIKLAAGRQPRE